MERVYNMHINRAKEIKTMKKIIAMILVAMLTMACFGAVAEEKKVLTVALSPDFAPMEFIDTSKSGQDQYVGFDVTLAKFIADELGMDLEIKAMSFDACQTAVQTGSVDLAISGFSWTEARAENFYLSDYYYAGDNETEQVIITTADKAGAFSTADDFSGLTVGCQDASLQADLCNSQLPIDCTIKPFKAIDDAILSLMSGKIDAVAVAKGNADAIIANNDSIALSGFEFEVSAEAQNNVVLIQKGNDELLANVNVCLAKAYEQGLYAVWYEDAKALAGIETAAEVTIEDEATEAPADEEATEAPAEESSDESTEG